MLKWNRSRMLDRLIIKSPRCIVHFDKNHPNLSQPFLVISIVSQNLLKTAHILSQPTSDPTGGWLVTSRQLGDQVAAHLEELQDLVTLLLGGGLFGAGRVVSVPVHLKFYLVVKIAILEAGDVLEVQQTLLLVHLV